MTDSGSEEMGNILKSLREVNRMVKAMSFAMVYGSAHKVIAICPECSVRFWDVHPDDDCAWGRVQRVHES